MTAPKLVEAQIDPDLQQMEENKARRRARITRPRWEPKKWHPVYEEIVLLSCLGYKNTDIALDKGLTAQHVSNILNTPQAKLIQKLILRRMEAKREETVDDWMDRMVNKGMKLTEKILDDETTAKKNPLGVVDRVFTLIRMAGKSKEKPEVREQTNNTVMLIPEEAALRLAKVIKATDDADKSDLEGKEEVPANFVTIGDGRAANS